MSPLVQIALFAWPAVALLLFAALPARKALLISLWGGWLFLPVHTFRVPFLPDYSKFTCVVGSCLLGVALFDAERFRRLHARRTDLLMLGWVLVPFGTSMSNGLGLYDGLVVSLEHAATWGGAYLLGRLYFSDYPGLRDFSVSAVVAGLVYAPFVLWESRMSPQLHKDLYGYSAHSSGFTQVYRLGGWRPSVFQDHGLMLGMLLTVIALLAAGLFLARERRALPWGLPLLPVAVGLAGLAVWSRSSAAIGLLFTGLAVMFAMNRFRWSMPIWVLIAIPIAYSGLRGTNAWDGQGVVQFVEQDISPDRAESLEYRFDAEQLLAEKARQRPILGWGGHDRGRVSWDRGGMVADDLVVADGLWIIAFNTFGLFGWVCLLGAFLLPLFSFASHAPPGLWFTTQFAVPAAVGLVGALFMVDSLLNAMVTPIYLVGLGGFSGFASSLHGVYREQRRLATLSPAQKRWRKFQAELAQEPAPREEAPV
ncbi:MAG: O-antigen ligase domain-containing protein [Planctomycetota bacterium]|jgi:hypothetical protein